jgi:hypothetical protein
VNTQASLNENATDESPELDEIWSCIQKGLRTSQTVIVCGVVGVKSDGMFTQAI